MASTAEGIAGGIATTWLATMINEGVLHCGHDAASLQPSSLAELSFVLPNDQVQLGQIGFKDMSNHVESCSAFKPSYLADTDRSDIDMKHLIETSFTRTVVLHQTRQDVPTSLERALGVSDTSAAILFSLSTYPEGGSTHNLVALADWLTAQGIDPRRGVALHYRTRNLPTHLSVGLVRSAPEDRARSLQRAWWNDYWVKLWQVAKADATEGLRQTRPEVSNEGQLVEWCAAQKNKAPPRKLPQKTNKSFLLLGGDAHDYRARAMQPLFEAGMLNNALLSLSLPKDCAHPAIAWRGFCGALPKKLDVDLHGELELTAKDITFANDALYRSTRFSVVMETFAPDDTCDDFLTEKVFKPIYRQHPFIVACANPRVLETLRSFGFRTFSPIVNESYDKSDLHHDCMIALNQLHRLVQLPDSEWLVPEEAAEFNKQHLLCPNGFGAKLIEHSAALMRFAMELTGGPAK